MAKIIINIEYDTVDQVFDFKNTTKYKEICTIKDEIGEIKSKYVEKLFKKYTSDILKTLKKW